MSASNRNPELLYKSPYAHPDPPTPPRQDLMKRILNDFIMWLRSAEGLRVCYKVGTDDQGDSQYVRAERSEKRAAVAYFVEQIDPDHYVPPSPLIQAHDNPLPQVNDDNGMLDTNELPF